MVDDALLCPLLFVCLALFNPQLICKRQIQLTSMHHTFMRE